MSLMWQATSSSPCMPLDDVREIADVLEDGLEGVEDHAPAP